ncbi:hypothetical protein M407DRAFT_18011 [Tulasnella calospora MUT 4182]|uniref:Uncharacterized protein n=1 Tax=Tulasnella calospora MUT 4182 TaxID=1051891 RepID=A0A0C3QWC7_9AGAM|nr:hypothetical protein M407DRAFT_18011 [Tulasnella calospora MUT 4182]
MAACVTTPRQTVFSTPVNVQTITNTITRTVTNPGSTVTQTVYYTQCIDEPVIISRFRRLKRQVECPNGTTVSTSYIVSESAPETITSTDISYDYVTNRGDPVAVDTQYGTSCSDIVTTPSPSPRTTTTTPETSSTSTSIFVPSPTPQPSPISRSIASTSTSTSSSASATATQDNIVVGHKSTKTAAIAGGAVGAVLFLAAVAGAIWYFKFWKAGGAGKGGHHGHHGGEKDDIDGTAGGGGGASGAQHVPGHGHIAHNVAPHHLGGTGVETSGAGGGGGGAGGPAGTAPGGGGVGMDTSAVAGGGYGGTAPPTSGLEGQYVNALPHGASAPAHHAYPVIVPVGARRRESQGPQDMVNTVSTPWIDPAQQQQQQQSGYYYPQQGPQQPWQNADPYTSASPAQYPGSGPGWADQAYYTSQSGYSHNGAQYPADPRMSQGGYPVDPRASGAYYPTSAPGHTSPVNTASPNRTSVISSPSSVDHPRHSLLPYMNEYGAPQPGPSVASTPAPPTSTTDISADPFDKHAEASASAAAGPSDHELPPPSYDEAGASAQPFVPQDAKGRPQ